MSAVDQMRAMLDELMGSARDGEEDKKVVKFDDISVCRSFLMGSCPHDLLASTRMDLGACHKIHDLALKADFEHAQNKKDYFFDVDAKEHLQQFIDDCDRRTSDAKNELAKTQEELTEEVAAKANRVHSLGEQIGQKLARAEALGEDGEVEESMKLMEEVEELRKQKTDAEVEFRNSMPASSYQQQKLRVCEVCSAYLGIHDNDQRLADHFGGKLHLGFIAIREKLAELSENYEARREERRRSRFRGDSRPSRDRVSRDRSSRDRYSRDRDRDRRSRRSGEREWKSRDRDHDRDRRRRSRDSRDRDRERSRDRVRERSPRDRDRERRKSRSRESSRDRDRRRSRDKERRRSRETSRDSERRREESNGK
ncbi:unnamed protein product [Cyprideis torosa]|uniref:Uncharacterized protein n=1 Tax=Cyprideis torosa TaxID=163714 RepID=A0A7R8WKK9_9CRUS|nr:unnamed protein product [Cyprideis torosa]CAG0896235.1 unnamed protein product [Cyprideis torosa]